MIRYHPSKSSPTKKKERKKSHFCALDTGGPVGICHVVGANSIPQSVWNMEQDATEFIRKAMGAHGVQKPQLGDAIC